MHAPRSSHYTHFCQSPLPFYLPPPPPPPLPPRPRSDITTTIPNSTLHHQPPHPQNEPPKSTATAHLPSLHRTTSPSPLSHPRMQNPSSTFLPLPYTSFGASGLGNRTEITAHSFAARGCENPLLWRPGSEECEG